MRILNKQEDIQSNEYYMCNIMDVIIMINNSLTFFIQISIFLAIGSTKINRTLKQDLQTVQARITQLERHNQILTAFNFNKTSQHKYNITHYDELEYFATNVTYQQLQLSKQMRNHCQMQTNANHQYFLFQTPRNFYVAINTHEPIYDLTTNATIYKKQLNVFNSECRKIAHMSNTLAKQIYCDRGLCDDGNVIILTDDLDLIICSEMRNFSSCSTYASIKNVIKGQVVGGAIRNKGSGQFQVYIADSQGQIIVFDGQGKIRLSIPIETDSKISYLVDIHPHPLIISSKGWIYSFQNNKYTLQLTKCPYLFHKITKVFVSHPYSSMIYLMSQETISKLQIKTQSKTCDLVQKYFPSQSVIQLSQNQTKNVGIAQYLGQLYIGDKIINLRQKETKKFIDCNKHTSFNFQLMKNTYRKGFFTLSCCHNEAQNPNQKCSIIIFKNSTDEQTSSKNNTILMIIILFLIMLVIFYFLKSNSPNLDYDQQLKYNNTFSYKNQVEEFLKNKASNNKNSVYQPHAPENSNMATKMKANEVKFD